MKEAAAACAAVVGIRKTTVDQLVEAAEISKGMFYKLYPSKEMLFLEMLEDMHRDAYKAADKVLKQFIQLNEAERTAKAFLREKVAADTVRALFLTISHRTEIGSDYKTVLQIVIEGTCSRMFST